MVLTWIGIAVMVAVLVYWVVWENRRLLSWTAESRGGPDPQVRARHPMDDQDRYPPSFRRCRRIRASSSSR